MSTDAIWDRGRCDWDLDRLTGRGHENAVPHLGVEFLRRCLILIAVYPERICKYGLPSLITKIVPFVLCSNVVVQKCRKHSHKL